MKISVVSLLITTEVCVKLVTESCELIALHFTLHQLVELVGKTILESTLVCELHFLVGGWISSIGSIGVTRLDVTVGSFPLGVESAPGLCLEVSICGAASA